MRSSLLIGLGTLALACAFFAGYKAQSQSSRGGGAVRAFTIYRHETMYPTDPKVDRHEIDWVIARRSDGSHMQSFTTLSSTGEQGLSVGILDVRNGLEVTIEPFTKSVFTRHLSQQEMPERRGELRSCTASQSALFSAAKSFPRMLGYMVAPDAEQVGDDMRSERWIALDLDCFPLKETQTWMDGARNEFTVTRVDEGEPRSSLFAVPPDYVERSPAQIEDLYLARYHEHLYGRVAETLDRDYRSHQLK